MHSMGTHGVHGNPWTSWVPHGIRECLWIPWELLEHPMLRPGSPLGECAALWGLPTGVVHSIVGSPARDCTFTLKFLIFI